MLINKNRVWLRVSESKNSIIVLNISYIFINEIQIENRNMALVRRISMVIENSVFRLHSSLEFVCKFQSHGFQIATALLYS